MISATPEISVIVPAFNGHNVLGRSLDALLRSDLPRNRWELIVIDDASSDDTAEIAARYADVIVRLPGKPHSRRPFAIRAAFCSAATARSIDRSASPTDPPMIG